MEPVFRTLEIAAKAVIKVWGSQIAYENLQNIPQTGGAVIAINHTSYVDWLFAGLAVHQRGRRIRYLIKAEMQQVKVVDYLIRHTKTIPVDRQAGAEAYAVAVQRLREGEVVGLMPEATISRSFELKEFKTGAARMALEAGVPIVPLIVWGAQRIWTKDRPKTLGRNKIPITVAVGRVLAPEGRADELTAVLRDEMTSVLYRVQQEYPHPRGAYWVPRRLGGGAPSPAEAARLEDQEAAVRAASRAAREPRPGWPGGKG
ncbi:1-acyl-sn-glycerol-3-phosphate acyltransferase [Mycobacterium heckeshornense]|uniref:1-acyl-sn-glycerol-3-phosphate acyltransferase n=1 Tax=Mycobacterium heckeshornense TaxID=110505 RepID=A0A2G8AVA0_9MYCO|nr:lysophospholipid acyltransferase family protein [Mycobacterium heckeshornense]KMV22029.1 acyltransferase [Mycobacterium heckeshornense]MCV7034498.1 1-acyl-sn-glycerol-3-phosphate acyltransferase [Mycobacterium heckeshornense]PIJ29441.1 1-acyl-sn-glycerol-3-phosphate acyltransferase [Mycobacterium heckeshornense]BCO33743.1 1-acyl-sn-glycerol-3-phosphate acyltransferase [Mycobacterium heckeshornense]BCQ06789.1 bifunctional protein Aas [Mycobacterium heckeshornense]